MTVGWHARVWTEAMEAMGEAKCKEFVAATQPGVFVWDAERKQVRCFTIASIA